MRQLYLALSGQLSAISQSDKPQHFSKNARSREIKREACSGENMETGCSAEHHVWVRFAPALFGNFVKPRWQSRNEDFDRGDPSSPIGFALAGAENYFFGANSREFSDFFRGALDGSSPSSEIEHEGRSGGELSAVSYQLSVIRGTQQRRWPLHSAISNGSFQEGKNRQGKFLT